MKYLNKEINGITLSRIGLGAMRMADVQQGVDTIHAALDSGITYLNTGDFYGHGTGDPRGFENPEARRHFYRRQVWWNAHSR